MGTINDLPEEEWKQLDASCRQRGLSWVDHRQMFGLWQDRPEASLAMQERLRLEWERP